ncbi:acyl-coenzyme A synthetase/AMP-(fatty) acid ligase [Streptacidiphilus sp. MAP12-16]|jgi:acetyl-CoA synthetase|uniref:AMP-binding protein n=1 Tax=Streptacidiphilus sp. MAP12-16 TaxID=3156300 RepID=UPI0035144DF0
MTTSTRTDRARFIAAQDDQVALHWVGENGEAELYTMLRLQELTGRAAQALVAAGVGEGDPVEVFLPTGPESVVVALACERLGARAVTAPEGFSEWSLRDRVLADGARVVVTADYADVDGVPTALKSMVDRALRSCPQVGTVLVVHRTARPVGWVPGRDLWWHQALATSGRHRRSVLTAAASATSSSSKRR